jgi:hypothetical protein
MGAVLSPGVIATFSVRSPLIRAAPNGLAKRASNSFDASAATAVLAEQMEARLARGEHINIQEYSLVVSTMVRVAQRIGIDRVPRDIAPSLAQYLNEGAAE